MQPETEDEKFDRLFKWLLEEDTPPMAASNSTYTPIWMVTTDTQSNGAIPLMNPIIKAVIAALTRAKVPFSTADIVQAVTAGAGAASTHRQAVLTELRNQLKTAGLQSVAVTSPQGNYGWLYTGVDQMVLPEGYAVRAEIAAVEAPPAKKSRSKKVATEPANDLRSSNDWMIAKGWTLPNEQAPTGWDMSQFFYSFYEQQISEQEFLRRWSFSYDPEQTLAIPEDFYKSFIAQLEAVTAAKNLDLLTPIQQLCLDKPDIENAVSHMQAARVAPNVDKAAVVEAAIDCQTIGDLLSVVYTANQAPANVQPATPA